MHAEGRFTKVNKNTKTKFQKGKGPQFEVEEKVKNTSVLIHVLRSYTTSFLFSSVAFPEAATSPYNMLYKAKTTNP